MRQPFLYAFGLFFLYIFTGTAQEYELSGTVNDQEGRPMSFVNVLLLNAQDSAMIKGATTMDDGRFLLENLADGNYLLKSSYVGYQTDLRKITVNGHTDAGSIILLPATEDLQGVTVSYRKPSIEKKPDRLVFNVANTTLSALSGYEIIKRTPGVIIMNDRITVKNIEPVIYLNEKRVYLSDDELMSLLQGYSGVNVDAVEVITNPPARYDAEGSVVLNIKTRNNVSIGYKGGLELKSTFGVFPKYNFNTQHYYKTKGLDFFFNYNYNRSKLFKNDESYINFTDVGSGEEYWETDFNKTTRENAHSVNSIMDITTGERSNLTLSANLFFSPDKTFENSARTDIIYGSPGISNYFETESDLENDTYNYVFGAEYNLILDDQGSTLNTAANYIYYQQEQLQGLNTVFYDTGGAVSGLNVFDTDGRQKNNIITLQSDLSTVVGAGNLGAGLKYARNTTNSSIDFTGISLPAGANSDAFEFSEAIYAAYTDFSRQWEKWELQLGLRAEYTDVDAVSETLGDVNTQEYFGLFPSVGLQHVPGGNHSYGLSYGRSIRRPRYESFNPFRYYIIENRYDEGNPGLTRSLEDKYTLNYTYKNQFTIELGHQYSDGDIQLLAFQDNEARQLYQTAFNIDHFKQYNIDISAPINISPRWFGFALISAYYMENRFIARESGNVLVDNNTNGIIASLYSGVTLGQKGNTNLDASYLYVSDFISGSWKYQNMHYLDISLRHQLWDKRAVLAIGLSDVFNTMNVPLNSTYLNQDNGFFSRPETRKFFVSFRYNFGNFRLQDNNRNTAPVELERLKKED